MRKGISVIKENLDYRGFWCNPRSRPSSVAIGAVCVAYAGAKWPLVSRGVFMGLLQGGTAKITPDTTISASAMGEAQLLRGNAWRMRATCQAIALGSCTLDPRVPGSSSFPIRAREAARVFKARGGKAGATPLGPRFVDDFFLDFLASP